MSIFKLNDKNQKYSSDIIKNILKFTPEMFQQMSFFTVLNYAEEAVKAKKYYELQHILKMTESSTNRIISEITRESIEQLDKKALEVITNFSKNSTIDYLKDGQYINQYMLDNLYEKDDIFEENINNGLKNEIYLLLLSAKSNNTITAQDLQFFSNIASKQEFEKFVQEKSINITSEGYQSLDLSCYQYDDKMPIKLINNSKDYKLIDILLNRTYANSMSVDSVTEIYNNIYGIGVEGKETLIYTATLIANGNPLKIIFENGALSYYSPFKEIIKIDTKFANETTFNIESVVAHELKHFVYNQIFNNDAVPINVTQLRSSEYQIFRSKPDYSYSFFVDNYSSMFKFLSSGVFNPGSHVLNLLDQLKSYELAATEPLKYLTKLIKADEIESNVSFDWARHLKLNSYLDLFYIKSQSLSYNESTSSHYLDDSTYNSLFNMYIKHEDFPKFYNKTELLNWAKDELYPEVVNNYNFTKTQIHFIERMADFVNRAEFFGRSFSKELIVELIVRSLELKVSMGNETEIINSFSALDKYHEENVSPYIQLYLDANSEISTLVFSDEFVFENCIPEFLGNDATSNI